MLYNPFDFVTIKSAAFKAPSANKFLEYEVCLISNVSYSPKN